MTALILKRAIARRPSGEWKDEDYDVLADGAVVGRTAASPVGTPWMWKITLASARQWCGSKGAYNGPSYPCHYCAYRGGLLRQGAVDKAKADDQRHAGEHQHHHLHMRKAVGGKQREIIHDTLPKDVPRKFGIRAETFLA